MTTDEAAARARALLIEQLIARRDYLYLLQIANGIGWEEAETWRIEQAMLDDDTLRRHVTELRAMLEPHTTPNGDRAGSQNVAPPQV